MQLFTHLTANDIKLERFPFRRELSMEAYLIENESVLGLGGEFADVEIIDEEMHLKGGRKSKGTDGRIDILAKYSQEYIGVVELKLGELNETHLQQLEDYLAEKNQIHELYPDILNKDVVSIPKWIGVLVGDSINAELGKKINDGYIANDNVLIAALTIQRFRGVEDGNIYVVTNTFFNEVKSVKDTTKYEFNGLVLGKGRLVLEVVKAYVGKNADIGFAGLRKAFPDHCQGSTGIISTYEIGREIEKRTGRKRHFLKPDEIVQLSDSKIVVSNQWGIRNIDGFIKLAKDIGYNIKTPN